jgi:RHS repeat-associated protein
MAAVRSRRFRSAVVVTAAASLLTAMVTAIPAAQAATVEAPPKPDPGPAVRKVSAVRPQVKPAPGVKDRPWSATATRWPAAASTRVELSVSGSAGAAAAPSQAGAGAAASGGKAAGTAAPAPAPKPTAAVKVTGTPVSVAPVAGRGGYSGTGQVTVSVSDHTRAVAAGVDGVLLGVTPSGAGSGEVRVSVDYSAFAQAYGGNYGSRLRISALPACALTTPQVAACQKATPLRSTNDPTHHSVSAQIALAPSATSPTSASPSTATTTAPSASAAKAGAAKAGAVSGTAATRGGVVALAVTAAADVDGGPAGSYGATTLKPSGSWAQGGSRGPFTYAYPVSLPNAASGLTPQVGLSYDSSAVDSQSATTQPQSSWVGDGWSTPASFIEQSFALCADNPEGSASPVSSADKCYDGKILTLSLNGSSSSLVWDSAKNVWRASDESGAVVAHVQNSANGTGTWNTDYWTVTDRAGTVYYFGRNQLPGWASGKATTNSVDWTPVYSSHAKGTGTEPNDPCYSSSGFAASVCTMAYRWNLDYVKDVHGNAMAYYYVQDKNFYGSNNGATMRQYVRDSHLDHVDYGFADGNAYGTVPNQVKFTTGDRCLSGTCQPLSSTTKANWPDVPFDLVCASGAKCSSTTPAMFSTVRLTTITTQQWDTATSKYLPVDSFALAHAFPATGDGTSPTLWLSSITRTGSDTTSPGASAITMPSVSFTMIGLPNRVDTVTDGLPGLYRYRIASVTTETGSVIAPTYTVTNPCTAPVTLAPATNTSSCYPVYWTPAGFTAPFLDWFQVYAVTRVTQSDPTGGAVAASTSYAYSGGLAWHYDDNELVKPKYRTYGQFRGYGQVTTLNGDNANDPQTKSVTSYYRGMSKNNSTTVVNVTDSLGGVHEDVAQLAGRPLEVANYLGNGGALDDSTITSYWVSQATATRTRSGLPDLTANWVAPAESFTRQAVTTGGTTSWRNTEVDTSYDANLSSATVGLPLRTYTHTSPVNSGYDSCRAVTYAPANATANIVGLISEAETDSVACGGYTAGNPASVPGSVNALTAPTVNRPAQVVSDIRTFYDDPTYATTFPQAAAPTKGDSTMVRQASNYSGGFVYQTTSKTTYDARGRVSGVSDANGNTTTTTYTDNAVGVPAAMKVTNPLSQSTTTTLDPKRGQPIGVTDANGITTTVRYDALGRTSAVWAASRSTTLSASATYAYLVQKTGISAVTTQQLNDAGGYRTSVTLYDAMLRPRQTQTMTALGSAGGRMVSDTSYDSRGWVRQTNNGWWDPSTLPNTTLVAPTGVTGSTLPLQHQYTYDGLGRQVVDEARQDNVTKEKTVTVYNGDRTTVIPPNGGTTQATILDPIGRTVELDQYTSAPTLTTPANTFTGIWYLTGGTTTKTTYGYDGHANRSTITDNAGSTWTTTYDLLGRATSKSDPDTGTSTLAYDANGNLTQTTDSRGKSTSTTYDKLNRKTARYAATTSAQAAGNQLAAWVYDNSNNAVTAMANPIGQLTTATAYGAGATGPAYVTQAKGFNVFGESLGQTVTIPSAEGNLAGSYAFSRVYTATTGLPLKDLLPTGGGLPAETLVHTYITGVDLPNGLAGLAGYSQSTSYDAFGRVNQQTIGGTTTATRAVITNTYNPHTGLITDQLITRSGTTPARVDEHAYAYDLAGNLTSDTNTRLGVSTAVETQCFTYDTLRRMTGAWTATDNCAATPTSASHATVGDPMSGGKAYWTNWSYDALGQRTAQIDHSTTGGADTTTTYTYNGNGKNQPHTLTGTTTSGGSSGSTSYSYDTSANMTGRNAAQGNQTLTYDDAGQLKSVTNAGGTSTYVYDADGNLLLQKNPGSTVLYLPGEQLTLTTSSGNVSGVRYYALPGGGQAYRTGTTTYGFEIGDRHGTGLLTLDATAQQPTWRQLTPFGAPRGTPPAWFDNRTFLDKPTDATTGLTRIGARNYDPATGRFITPDPVLDGTDPQALNGFTYAGQNPTTFSDPTGLMLDCGPSGAACGVPAYNHYYETHNADGTSIGNTTGMCDRNSCGGVSSGSVGKPAAAPDSAAAHAKARADSAKARMMELGKQALIGVADFLGLKDAYDCVVSGDIGGCVMTVANIALTMFGEEVGALAWKLITRFGEAKRLAKLVNGAIDAFREWRSAETVMLDASTARAMVTDTPVGASLRQELKGCNLVMCATAHQEWSSAMGRLAGPNETALGARLSTRLTVVPDNPSARAMGLKLTKKVGVNDRIIFGTADQMGLKIYTSDSKFLRGAGAQGVDFDAVVHAPASPNGW